MTRRVFGGGVERLEPQPAGSDLVVSHKILWVLP